MQLDFPGEMASFEKYSKDPRLIEETRRIINGGSAKIHKSTRTGFTTSAVIAAMDEGKSLLCIAPTNRILQETLNEASGDSAIIISANHNCPDIQDIIGNDRFLEKLPIHLENCDECIRKGHCPVTDVIQQKGNLIIGITYQKLIALMLSRSKIAKQIRNELSKVDIVMLDEAHMIAIPRVIKVKIFTEVDMPGDFPH